MPRPVEAFCSSLRTAEYSGQSSASRSVQSLENQMTIAVCGSFSCRVSVEAFASNDFEVDFKGRGTVADLTPLGRSELGLPPEANREQSILESVSA